MKENDKIRIIMNNFDPVLKEFLMEEGLLLRYAKNIIHLNPIANKIIQFPEAIRNIKFRDGFDWDKTDEGILYWFNMYEKFNHRIFEITYKLN